MEAQQIEFYYSLVFQLATHLGNGAAAGIFACLCRSFVPEKKKRCLIGGSYFLTMVALYYIPWEFNGFVVYWLGMGAAFLTTLYLDRGRVASKLYLAITFDTMRWICGVIAVHVYRVTADKAQELLVHRVGNNERLGQAFFILFCLTEMFYLALRCVLLLVLTRLLEKCFPFWERELNQKELCSLLIPSFLGIANHLIRFHYNDRWGHISTWQGASGSTTMDFLWCVNDVILLIAIFLVLALFVRQRQEQDQRVLQRQIMDMQSHIREVEQIYARIQGVRHDLGNHAQALSGLIHKGQYEEAKRYTSRLKEAGDGLAFEISTGNPITDVILNEKNKQAKEQNIRFVSRFSYPSCKHLDVFDVNIILSNGLENALEASRFAKEPFVELESRQVKNAWLIKIVNGVSEDFSPKDSNGFLRSTKNTPQLHGFGLKNIREVAEKYYGKMEIAPAEGKDGKLVILTVMLQLP